MNHREVICRLVGYNKLERAIWECPLCKRVFDYSYKKDNLGAVTCVGKTGRPLSKSETEFYNKVLKFGQAFGFEETYSVLY